MGTYTLDYYSKYYFFEEGDFESKVEEGTYILENIKKSNRFDYKGHSFKYTKFGNISMSDTKRDVDIEVPGDDINVIIGGESKHLDLIYKFETKYLEDHVRIATRISEIEDDISCLLYVNHNQADSLIKDLEVIKSNQENNMNK